MAPLSSNRKRILLCWVVISPQMTSTLWPGQETRKPRSMKLSTNRTPKAMHGGIHLTRQSSEACLTPFSLQKNVWKFVPNSLAHWPGVAGPGACQIISCECGGERELIETLRIQAGVAWPACISPACLPPPHLSCPSRLYISCTVYYLATLCTPASHKVNSS